AAAAAADISKSPSTTKLAPSTTQSVQPSPLSSMTASPIGIPPGLPGTSFPDGLEGLSEEERMKIMAVMACAAVDSPASSPFMPSPQPPPSSIPVSTSAPIPPGLEGLSEEEREKIMAVMACAAID
ncbi:hypothetical protein PFISCL1PPCAC_15324, partial [Pristionchus fissidentatus]